MIKIINKLLALAVGLLIASSCFAAWPTKEITIVVPYTAGGLSDRLARAISDSLQKKYKVPVIVQNIPGGDGAIALNNMLNKDNDNHTFLFGTNYIISGLHFQGNNNYKKLKAATIFATDPFVVFGNQNNTSDNFKKSVAQGDAIFVAVGGVNIPPDLWLSQLTPRQQFQFIPYKGTPPVLNDVWAGTVQYGILTVGGSFNLIKEKKLFPIMVSSTQRLKVYPDVPTYKELGFNGRPAEIWLGVLALDTTSNRVVEQLSADVREIVAKDPGMQGFKDEGLTIINLDTATSNKKIQQSIQDLQ